VVEGRPLYTRGIYLTEDSHPWQVHYFAAPHGHFLTTEVRDVGMIQQLAAEAFEKHVASLHSNGQRSVKQRDPARVVRVDMNDRGMHQSIEQYRFLYPSNDIVHTVVTDWPLQFQKPARVTLEEVRLYGATHLAMQDMNHSTPRLRVIVTRKAPKDLKSYSHMTWKGT
jgi:hypothetical protein